MAHSSGAYDGRGTQSGQARLAEPHSRAGTNESTPSGDFGAPAAGPESNPHWAMSHDDDDDDDDDDDYDDYDDDECYEDDDSYEDDDYDGVSDGGAYAADTSGKRAPAKPQRPHNAISEGSLRISREHLFKLPVPHAPRSGMEHGLVRRVVGKYYAPGASPRSAFIHLSQERPRSKPKHRRQKQRRHQRRQRGTFAKAARASQDPRHGTYKHKHRRLHNPADAGGTLTNKGGTSPPCSSSSSASSPGGAATRKKTDVPGAKLYAFTDRPEVLTAAREITRTNDRMARQLNRLCEKRTKLDKQFKTLLARAHHFTEVEGKALLHDKSARDDRIESLTSSLTEQVYKADYAQFQIRQYKRLLRRAKRLARDQARKVVTLQEDLGKFTDPVGGHVARARNNVVVANQAFDVENKHLEETRSELFEEVRDRAGKLSELRQNTTDQRLAIELEEATVFRREKIRKQALLDMAFDENKRLVSRALQTTSKRKVTRRKVLQMSAMLARFERMMSRLKQATGVTGIDAVVKRWFERTEREKALHGEGRQYEINIENYKKGVKSMTEQLSNLRAFGSNAAYSRRADRNFDKILGAFDVRSKAASARLSVASQTFQNRRLHLGLIIECVRSLSVRFKLDAETVALTTQLHRMQEYNSPDENIALGTRLNRCLKALRKSIGGLIQDLSGKILEIEHAGDASVFAAGGDTPSIRPPPEAGGPSPSDTGEKKDIVKMKGGARPVSENKISTSSSRLSKKQRPAAAAAAAAAAAGGVAAAGEGKMKQSNLRYASSDRPSGDEETATLTKRQYPSTGQASGKVGRSEPGPLGARVQPSATIMDLPLPLGPNVRVQTRRMRRVGDQVPARNMPMQRITQQLLDQVQYNGVQWARVFQAIDTDGSGQIRRSEFAQVLRDLNINVSSSDLELLMERFDQNRDDKLDYEEFLLMVGGKVRGASDSADSSESDEDNSSVGEGSGVKRPLSSGGAVVVVGGGGDLGEEGSGGGGGGGGGGGEGGAAASGGAKKEDLIRRESLVSNGDTGSVKKNIAGLEERRAKKAVFDLSSVLSKAADMVVEDKASSGSSKQKKAGDGERGRKRGNYADNMQNEIRASNAALVAQRKAKRRQFKAKEHERLLKMNIQKAKTALKSGDQKRIRPEGFLKRRDLKHWASEVASHGERLEQRRRVRRGEADWDISDDDLENETDPRKRRKRQRRKLKGKGKMSLIQRQAENIKKQKTARMKRQEEAEAIVPDTPNVADENVSGSPGSDDVEVEKQGAE